MSSYISSIGTAVPSHRISQSEIGEFMLRHLPLSEDEQRTLKILYRASGIQYRHSVIGDFGRQPEEFTFFPSSPDLEPFPKVSQRMAKYEQEAIKLCEDAVKGCLQGRDVSGITHLITVSCTGMYAPGLDIQLVERLGFRTNIQRTAINFMGCYASFNALKVADQIVRNDDRCKVLIVSVELCSLHVLKKTDEDSLLSNALFGDGAAAVLVEGKSTGTQLEIAATYADLALSGKNEMAWHINDFGFEMKLSVEVPEVIRQGIGTLTERLLNKLDLKLEDVDYFGIHPGGRRILEVIESELNISKSQNQPAYDVLKNYGNMSSPTVLFVIKLLMDGFTRADDGKNLLSFAFGPGLTMESMLFKIHNP